MQISVDTIKSLREETGAGIMDCKKALIEANGDSMIANGLLKKKGLAIVQKKAGRTASKGLIESYVHGGGRIGVLIEVNCETDFVARTDDFKELAHNLAMQVVAMDPTYISNNDIPQGEETEANQTCLLLQPYIRDQQLIVQDIINEVIAKVGENIQVRRFVRYELGCWEDE